MTRDGTSNRERFPYMRGQCRMCSKPVAPPRESFCGPRCVRDFFMQTDWRLVKEVVLTRDRHTCMECGCRGLGPSEADAHHIVPISQGGDEWALDNIETLCRACHRKAHARLAEPGEARP